MPKATQAGASDQAVHPDYIAPAGVAPQEAIDHDMPDQGAAPEEPRQAPDAPDTGEQKSEKQESGQRPAKKSARSHITKSDEK